MLPAPDLAVIVDVMLANEHVAGALVLDENEPVHGLAIDLATWGTDVHSFRVVDYKDKIACIARVSELAETLGVRRKYRQGIELCLDEMLMNAIYDAPGGTGVHADAELQVACDGKRFAVSVRDGFGTLARATVLRYLHKCLHQAQQIDNKVGGAGLGLYMLANTASAVVFSVRPGASTQVTCVFDLTARKLQLRQFGFLGL